MIKESQIVYETLKHWVLDCGSKGFEVYRKTITHSERCSVIGFQGSKGLERAKQEIERRESTC
jgi:hypothetical protein